MRKEVIAVDCNISDLDPITVVLAFLLAFVFACSSGNLRLKAPEETELTLAKVIRQKLSWHKK